MRKQATGKSYGKLILAGEHAVVYGKPAIIFPINRFCEVKISPVANSRDHSLQIVNNKEDKHGIVKYTLKEFFKKFKIENKENLQIKINSGIPVGRGFGSSAAVITALVKGLSKYFSISVTPSRLLYFCISCENLVHEKSSGADIYAAWFGKPIYFQTQNGKIVYKILDSDFPTNYYLIDTGKPLESTGEMVDIVKRSKVKARPRESGKPSLFQKNIDLIEIQTKLLYKILTTSPQQQLLSDVSIHETIDKIENCLENLGVVSKKVKRFITALNSQKISAKICGAGGESKGAGIVVAFTKNKKAIKTLCSAYKYSVLDVKIQT